MKIIKQIGDIIIDEKHQVWKVSNINHVLEGNPDHTFLEKYTIEKMPSHYSQRMQDKYGHIIIMYKNQWSDYNPIKLIKDRTPYLKYIIGA